MPAGLVGPKKSLKTNISLDLAVSLATGGRLLGYFNVPEPRRIAVMSGESGMATIQETTHRVCDAANVRLADTDIIFSDTLPRIGDALNMQAFQRFFGRRQLTPDQPNVLPGNGSSAGVARGPARVLLKLDEADRLAPGDVLVARTTMPPWTPLFAVASALVVESGGILSHAAVTAREYGIPAVVGVDGATRVIRDGQLIEVDGTRGTVRIL